MNHLAHFFLARRSSAAVTGALLGDFVKGAVGAGAFPPAMRREIIIHRHVDAFTDRDERLSAAKIRFVKTRRRLTGIVLDVAFDHYLAVHWNDFTNENLDVFAQTVYRGLERHADRFPAGFRAVLPQMIADDWLAAYRDFARVERALHRLATRVRGGETLHAAFAEVSAGYEYFDAVFRDFFPRLRDFIADKRGEIE